MPKITNKLEATKKNRKKKKLRDVRDKEWQTTFRFFFKIYAK
jgi:hypothetical protein